jgi:hypothetical protein
MERPEHAVGHHHAVNLPGSVMKVRTRKKKSKGGMRTAMWVMMTD